MHIRIASIVDKYAVVRGFSFFSVFSNSISCHPNDKFVRKNKRATIRLYTQFTNVKSNSSRYFLICAVDTLFLFCFFRHVVFSLSNVSIRIRLHHNHIGGVQ